MYLYFVMSSLTLTLRRESPGLFWPQCALGWNLWRHKHLCGVSGAQKCLLFDIYITSNAKEARKGFVPTCDWSVVINALLSLVEDDESATRHCSLVRPHHDSQLFSSKSLKLIFVFACIDATINAFYIKYWTYLITSNHFSKNLK